MQNPVLVAEGVTFDRDLFTEAHDRIRGHIRRTPLLRAGKTKDHRAPEGLLVGALLGPGTARVLEARRGRRLHDARAARENTGNGEHEMRDTGHAPEPTLEKGLADPHPHTVASEATVGIKYSVCSEFDVRSARWTLQSFTDESDNAHSHLGTLGEWRQ